MQIYMDIYIKSIQIYAQICMNIYMNIHEFTTKDIHSKRVHQNANDACAHQYVQWKIHMS
jgi:hypothetical protein